MPRANDAAWLQRARSKLGFAPSRLGPEDRFATPAMLAFIGGICVYLAFFERLFVDGDTGWHVAAGRYMLATRSVPNTDPFSYTFAGHAWHAQEWLAEVAMAAVFNAAGWSGLALLFAIAGGTTLWLCGRELMRRLSIPWAICAMVVLCGVLYPPALARPHMLAWVLLAGWVLILVHARDAGRAPQPAALLIMLVWANLHASYMLGLGIAGVLTLEALLAHRRDHRTALRWLAFGLGALLAACITPHGINGFLYPFAVSKMRALTVISEWRATSFNDDKLFIAAATGVWLLIAARWRQIHPLRIALLAGLTAMAMAHARHQMLFAIVAALFVAPLFAHDDVRRDEALGRSAMWSVAAAAALALMAIRLLIPFDMQDNSAFPMRAIGRVPAPLRAHAVFNGYSFGGPLILAGVRPYIDGRADMYGDAFTLDYVAMLRGDMMRFRRADRRWRFGWTILPPKVGLVAKLDRAPEWRRLYADRWAVIHVRRPER